MSPNLNFGMYKFFLANLGYNVMFQKWNIPRKNSEWIDYNSLKLNVFDNLYDLETFYNLPQKFKESKSFTYILQ